MVKNLWQNIQEAVTTIFVRKVKKLRGNRIPKLVRKLQIKRKQLFDKIRRTKCCRNNDILLKQAQMCAEGCEEDSFTHFFSSIKFGH